MEQVRSWDRIRNLGNFTLIFSHFVQPGLPDGAVIHTSRSRCLFSVFLLDVEYGPTEHLSNGGERPNFTNCCDKWVTGIALWTQLESAWRKQFLLYILRNQALPFDVRLFCFTAINLKVLDDRTINHRTAGKRFEAKGRQRPGDLCVAIDPLCDYAAQNLNSLIAKSVGGQRDQKTVGCKDN